MGNYPDSSRTCTIEEPRVNAHLALLLALSSHERQV
jgi:hypothetical protein